LNDLGINDEMIESLTTTVTENNSKQQENKKSHLKDIKEKEI